MQVLLLDFDGLEYFSTLHGCFRTLVVSLQCKTFFLPISRSNGTATAWVRLNHVGVVLRPPHFTPRFNFAAASTNMRFHGLFIIFRRCVGAKPKTKFECRHRCASKIFGTTFQRVFRSPGGERRAHGRCLNDVCIGRGYQKDMVAELTRRGCTKFFF